MTYLWQSDLSSMVDLVQQGHADEPGPRLPWSVLAGLQKLVPCDAGIGFQEADLHRRRWLFSQGMEECGEGWDEGVQETTDPPDDLFWELFWSSVCSLPQRTGDLASILAVGGSRADREDPVHADVSLPDGVVHHMVLSLPAPPGRMRRVLFNRAAGPAFSERDKQVLALLRPHLQEIWLAAERRRRGVPELTAREWDVLVLAAQGQSNADIARTLVISVGTVRKHMEHVFDRLGVRTRGAAAALALPFAPWSSGIGR